MSAEISEDLYIVGWYHSHPHITVWPSDVGNIYEVCYIILIFYI